MNTQKEKRLLLYIGIPMICLLHFFTVGLILF